MKRIVLFWLMLSIGLCFTACTATDPNNLFEITTIVPGDTTVGTISSTDATEPIRPSSDIDSIDYEVLEAVYQYGNMQKGGGFMRLGKHVLFTFLREGKNRLYTYDLTSGKVRLYCDDATCSHQSCCAGGIMFGLEVYNGKIFTTAQDFQTPGNFQLTEITDTKRVPVTSGPVFCAFHHDNNLYFKSSDSSLAVQDESSAEIRVLIDEYTGSDAVIFENYLYTNLSDNSFVRIDVTAAEPKEEVLLTNVLATTDGQFIYYVDMASNLLSRCNLDGTGADPLLDKPILPASINFDDEYFYFRLFTSEKGKYNEDSYDLYRFPKNDPTTIEKIATIPDPIFQVFTIPGTKKIFVSVYVQQSYGDSCDVYVMNTDGSNMTKLDIPEF